MMLGKSAVRQKTWAFLALVSLLLFAFRVEPSHSHDLASTGQGVTQFEAHADHDPAVHGHSGEHSADEGLDHEGYGGGAHSHGHSLAIGGQFIEISRIDLVGPAYMTLARTWSTGREDEPPTRPPAG